MHTVGAWHGGHSLLFGMCLKFDQKGDLFSIVLIMGKNHWKFSTHINVDGEARSVIYMQMSKGSLKTV